MGERLFCVHGHFYQPPRENPWLGAVETQDSAWPYHDWNERITAECYGPNAASRVLDGHGRVSRIVDNYAGMSFNFGPTLLSWMEKARPDVYGAILEADRSGRRRFGGHGPALAQAYSHAILPLCNARDRETQVRWGLADFSHRFGRPAEGMWLPEAAADVATLEILAAEGVKFTILAPRQARRVRPPGRPWHDVEGIDPRRAYRCRLPSGAAIALFFYDGPVSQAVAFERLLESGERLAERLLGAFDGREEPQLVHIATDGETYGHHFEHGDMALAYATELITSRGLATATVYGAWLERFPPTWRVEIHDDSSWSCSHGVERWRSDCGCSSGREGWSQGWRGPLRDALDFLRDAVGPAFEQRAGELVRDPWAARDGYIDVVLEPSPERVAAFFARHAARPLSEPDRAALFEMLEIQRHAMLMYTSCGWFFDELSGLETVQVLRYAGRVVQMARDALGLDLEEALLARLEFAPSNLPEFGDGRGVWKRCVRPAMQAPGDEARSAPFWEEQQRILAGALRETVREAEATWQRFFDHHAPLMRYVAGLERPLPRALSTAAEVVADGAIRRHLAQGAPDVEALRTALTEALALGVALDAPGLGLACTRAIDRLMDGLAAAPDDVDGLRRAADLVAFSGDTPFDVDLWHAQNVWWRLHEEFRPGQLARAARKRGGRRWLEAFDALGEALGMAV